MPTSPLALYRRCYSDSVGAPTACDLSDDLPLLPEASYGPDCASRDRASSRRLPRTTACMKARLAVTDRSFGRDDNIEESFFEESEAPR
jgi:hypothetical protein